MKNILILSVGTRNKVVQFFKNEFKLEGNIICTDMSPYAPALYEGDNFYITPRITDKNYINTILNICKTENIDAICSLIDPELELLAQNKDIFNSYNIKLLQSDFEVIEKSFNKYQFYKEVTKFGYSSQLTIQDYKQIKENIESGNLKFPVFVKPNLGSASLNINKVGNSETLYNLLDNHQNLIVQEFINAKEYGVDVYIDYLSGDVISIFIKEKLKMRAGETDKSISIHNLKIFELIEQFVKDMGYKGQIDIDLFIDDNNNYYISEVNPRFGGGYPHAHLSGCNFINLILNNLKGIENQPQIGNYKEGTVMMKYNEVLFKDEIQ